MDTNSLEKVGYALVLLQEICLGYDTHAYRSRCAGLLRDVFSQHQKMLRLIEYWVANAVENRDMLRAVEAYFERNPF